MTTQDHELRFGGAGPRLILLTLSCERRHQQNTIRAEKQELKGKRGKEKKEQKQEKKKGGEEEELETVSHQL